MASPQLTQARWSLILYLVGVPIMTVGFIFFGRASNPFQSIDSNANAMYSLLFISIGYIVNAVASVAAIQLRLFDVKFSCGWMFWGIACAVLPPIAPVIWLFSLAFVPRFWKNMNQAFADES